MGTCRTFVAICGDFQLKMCQNQSQTQKSYLGILHQDSNFTWQIQHIFPPMCGWVCTKKSTLKSSIKTCQPSMVLVFWHKLVVIGQHQWQQCHVSQNVARKQQNCNLSNALSGFMSLALVILPLEEKREETVEEQCNCLWRKRCAILSTDKGCRCAGKVPCNGMLMPKNCAWNCLHHSQNTGGFNATVGFYPSQFHNPLRHFFPLFCSHSPLVMIMGLCNSCQLTTLSNVAACIL